MKIIRSNTNLYWKVKEEFEKILPQEETRLRNGFIFKNIPYYYVNWWMYWNDYDLVVHLYRPEFERQFINICKKYDVEVLYIDE